MPDFQSILNDHFRLPVRNERLTLLMSLKECYPHSQHVAVSASVAGQPFPLSSYMALVKIDAQIVQDPSTQKFFEWDDQLKQLYADVVTGLFKFTHNNVEFLVCKVTWDIR